MKPNLTLFISDIHLSEKTPELTQLFIAFLEHFAPQAGALYILGDLFDYWLGDDDDTALAKTVQNHLRHLAEQGTAIYIMPGNRDILLGTRFANAAKATLLQDPTIIELYGEKTLLMHGDSLCTLDKKHQKYRKLTLNPVVRFLFLSLPLTFRQKIAAMLRKRSKGRNHEFKKNPEIFDVNPIEIERVMDEYQVSQLIHGHVHKPKIYPGDRPRMVLGDWKAEPMGSTLICSPEHFELQVFVDA